MNNVITCNTSKLSLFRDYVPLPIIKPRAPLDPAHVKTLSARLKQAIRSKNRIDLIGVLVSLSNRQRQQVRKQYTKDYGNDLFNDLKKQFRGDFQDVMLSLITPPTELICKHLNKAMTGLTTNEKTLVELLVPRSHREMIEVLELYEKMFNRPLVEHVCSSTSSHFRRLLTLILTSKRDEQTETNDGRARDLAAELYTATEVKHTKDHTVFNRILSRESFGQLRLVFDQYEELSGGTTIEEAVAKEMSGDLYDGIIAIVECVRYIPGFFAGCIFRALNHWATDDTALIRLLITRSEIDLSNIKQSYQQIYNKDLVNEIQSSTSGEYRCALLALLGQRKAQ